LRIRNLQTHSVKPAGRIETDSDVSIEITSAFAKGRISHARLERALLHIERHIAGHISLQDLADAAALSRYHFCRSFHRTTGRTPLQYILERRVAAAKVHLLNPDFQLAHIAFLCGFASASHFATSFKAVTGMTSCQYRRTL